MLDDWPSNMVSQSLSFPSRWGYDAAVPELRNANLELGHSSATDKIFMLKSNFSEMDVEQIRRTFYEI